MKATKDNTFIGATLTKGKDKYLVVKVNQKTVYLLKNKTKEDYDHLLLLKGKSSFKDFCKKNKIEALPYEGFEISEEESKKKAVVEQNKNQASSALGKAEKMVLTELLKQKKLHRLQNIAVGDKILRVVEIKDRNKFFINVENEYILYNMELDVVCKAGSVFDYDTTKQIEWEKITP